MSNMSEEDRANLVAYLDGELDEEAAQALEARMSTDPQFRAEADAFERTWELLDFLPRPEPSTSFTNKTLERLAISDRLKTSRAGPYLAPLGRRTSQWLLGIGWAAALVLAVGGGLWAAQHLWPPTAATGETSEVEELLVRSLRVIENQHLYDAVDDLDFLRALDHPELFGDETVGG